MSSPEQNPKGIVDTGAEEGRDAELLDDALSRCELTITAMAEVVGPDLYGFVPGGSCEPPLPGTDRRFMRRILEHALEDPLPFRVLSLQLSARERARDTQIRLRRGTRP